MHFEIHQSWKIVAGTSTCPTDEEGALEYDKKKNKALRDLLLSTGGQFLKLITDEDDPTSAWLTLRVSCNETNEVALSQPQKAFDNLRSKFHSPKLSTL